MLKRILIIALAAAATGCAGSLKFVGDLVDRQDQCQSRGQANYNYPSYCGSGAYAQRETVYTDRNGVILGYGSNYYYRQR